MKTLRNLIKISPKFPVHYLLKLFSKFRENFLQNFLRIDPPFWLTCLSITCPGLYSWSVCTMWKVHFNFCFKRSLGALVYSDEKVVCIVITQSTKCFLEERNSGSIFLEEEKKIIPNFFRFQYLSKQKCVPISTKFFEKDSKVPLKCPWNRTRKS